MNPFVSRINNQPWILPITGMCLVLGFMISMAWVTEINRSSRNRYMAASQLDRIKQSLSDGDNLPELQAQVNSLQAKITKLENALASQDDQTKVLNDNLQEAKIFAAMTELEGPGVLITLQDDTSGQRRPSPGGNAYSMLPTNGAESVIHDIDVLQVVNELYAAGAEAISVNDIRLAAGSSVRCVGPTILVNDMKVASPVRIAAIGDPKTLYGGMNLPNGVLDVIRLQNPSMVQIEKVQHMRLPGFVGNTAKRIGKVPKDKK